MVSGALGQVVKSLNIPILPVDNRYMETETDLVEVVEQLRQLGLKIVLTSGTYDMLHIGHARYLREARLSGDLLIVGLDDDAKTRKRKGEYRPVVPEDERREMLAHCRYVDFIYIKRTEGEKWGLIKMVKPDVLIAVEGTYQPEELEVIRTFCGEVKVLPRQAETSTSAKVRRLVVGGLEEFMRKINEAHASLKDGF